MNIDWYTKIKNSRGIVIFGQEDYASRIETYVQEIFDGDHSCISIKLPLSVDRPDGTNFDLEQYEYDLLKVMENRYVVVGAFSVKFHGLLVDFFIKVGINNYILYNSELDNEMKKWFFKIKFKEGNKNFRLINEKKKKDKLTVYLARSIYDKKIENIGSKLSDFEQEIQVGAALTNKRICALTDDLGDNISDRNKRYCEMTAAYWAWKHSTADYIGLSHYRRRFKNIEDIAEKLGGKEDVVLPLPTLAGKSVFEDYLEKHITDVYPIMLEALERMAPEYSSVSESVWSNRIFYASNMWIMKKEVLNDFMSWMFPILFEIERGVNEKFKNYGNLPERSDGETGYFNRYAGFCAERLTTLYFVLNLKNLLIVHAEKEFLS